MSLRRADSFLRLASLLAAPLLHHAVAAAEVPAPPAPQTEPAASTAADLEAESAYRRGLAAYARGRYVEAIELFRTADRLRPSAALSFNVASAYERLHDIPAALEMYRDYLRRSPGGDEADTRRRIEALEAQLARRGVQQLTIRSAPAGATVLVDGKAVGVTPWTREIAPGEHSLGVRRAGFTGIDAKVTLPADRAVELSYALLPIPPLVADIVPVPPPGPPPAPPTTMQDDHGRGSARPWATVGVITLGAGGLLLGGALTFELLRRSAASDAEGEPRQDRAAEHLDLAESRQRTARVLLGTGAALAATGAVVLVVDLDRSTVGRRVATRLSCLPSWCGASASGTF